ncbi:MAG TPA: hypothetical protein PLW24_14180, partial [Burkholderiaceae bacterium]|nr:hypothetical protein [Burkholderiaceae bacterium]
MRTSQPIGLRHRPGFGPSLRQHPRMSSDHPTPDSPALLDLPALLEHYQGIDVWVLEAFTRYFVESQVEPGYRGFFEGKEKS